MVTQFDGSMNIYMIMNVLIHAYISVSWGRRGGGGGGAYDAYN